MVQLRQELTELGLEKVETYINSGNIFFTSTTPKAQLVEKLEAFFEIHYPFIKSFLLLNPFIFSRPATRCYKNKRYI